MSARRGRPVPPLVAILRGLDPARATDVGAVLYEAGFRALEVPLNRPGALQCIGALARSLCEDCLLGAGTVLTASSVDEAADQGAALIVAPHCDPEVVTRALARDLLPMPGVATPTEALRALHLGASALKAFPAEGLPPAVIRSWRSVIMKEVPIFPVGGITPAAMPAYYAAGASGFGIGSGLFESTLTLDDLSTRARSFIHVWNELQEGRSAI